MGKISSDVADVFLNLCFDLQLPDLVEANPLIAIDVLLKLMQSNQFTELVF